MADRPDHADGIMIASLPHRLAPQERVRERQAPTRSAPARARYASREIIGLVFVLAIFSVLGINGVLHLAFRGQDFALHDQETQQLIAHPGRWFWTDYTCRPLIYWLEMWGDAMSYHHYGYQSAAYISLAFGAAGLLLLHDSIRPYIPRLPLRLALTAFLAFLPVNYTTTIAFAGDTTAIFPYAFCCWGLIRAAEAKSRRSCLAAVLAVVMGLTLGQFAKLPFLGLTLAVVVLVALACRWQTYSRPRAIRIALAALVVPLAVGLYLWQRCRTELAGEPARHHYNWHGTGEMTWRSLWLLKSSDSRILDAPAYWDIEYDRGAVRQPMVEPNGYSYFALLHLGTFSDVLGLTYRPSHEAGATRSPAQQFFTVWSVRLGLVFSLAALVALGDFAWKFVRSLVTRRAELSVGRWVWGGLGVAWFLPIFAMLPFVERVYAWGYWLPRLILPTIWGLAVVLAGAASSWIERTRHAQAWSRAVLLLVSLQMVLQVFSLWA